MAETRADSRCSRRGVGELKKGIDSRLVKLSECAAAGQEVHNIYSSGGFAPHEQRHEDPKAQSKYPEA